MDKLISIFIFSCICLQWTAVGSDSAGPETTKAAVGSAGESNLTTASSDAVSTIGESTASPTNAPQIKNDFSQPYGTPKPMNKTEQLTNDTIPTSPSPTVTEKTLTNTPSGQTLNATSPTTTQSQNKTIPSITASSSAPNLTADSTQAPHGGSSGNLNEHEKPKESSEKRFLWILLPVLCVLLAAMIYLKFKCKKVQHRPEMTDNGTENASFQRTDSNKDGVMLLGVSKTSAGEDNAAAS